MNRSLKTISITLISFGVYFFLDEKYFGTTRNWIYGYINQFGISHILAYTIFGLPIFLGVFIMHKKDQFFESIGLDRSVVEGAKFALLCTLPMFVGFALLFDFSSSLTLDTILISVLAAAFFEEIYFRGFLFGQIFRYTNLGFLPSVLIGAILFGLVHLYQGTGIGESVGIFLITFLGGILFAWVYVEWNYNIWVSIFLHLFMNLSWELFSVSDNALGGVYSNVFRILTIAMIIGLTLVNKKRKEEKLVVNRRTIWMKE